MKNVKESYGTDNCIQLKKNGVSCDEIIDYIDNLLENVVK